MEIRNLTRIWLNDFCWWNYQRRIFRKYCFQISNGNVKLLEQIYKQLPTDWQLFYLGYGHQDASPAPNYTSNLIKIHKNGHFYPDCTIGFAVGKEYSKILYERNRQVIWTADANLQLTFKNTDCVAYASVPKIIFPEGKDSVVENKIL